MVHPLTVGIDALKQASPHIRLIVPAAAALIWTLKRITGHHGEPEDLLEDDEAASLGSICSVTGPVGKKQARPSLPYKVPAGKATVLLDVMIPTTVAAFWKAIFQNDSDAFERYHASMGDRDIYVGSWREKEEETNAEAEGGSDMLRRRRVSFIKPLKNPLGPRQAANQETFRLVDLSPNGFTVECVCRTSGVPFASSFQNELLWVGYQVEDNVMRLIVSGECRFTESVFGMLKGTIVRESVQGMRNAYNKYFREVVREAFGVIEEEEGEDKKGGLVGAKGGLTDGVMNLAATNPALFVALLAAIVIIMRMITQQQLYTHLLRKAMAA